MSDPVRQFKGFGWHAWAASILALLYVLPHLWWMFGISLGFPGDSADFDVAFDRTWFVLYNGITTALVALSAAAVVSLDTCYSRPVVAQVVRVGAILLLLRGGLGVFSMLAGFATSLFSWAPAFLDTEVVAASLIWEFWFVITGLVFFRCTRSHRPYADQACQT